MNEVIQRVARSKEIFENKTVALVWLNCEVEHKSGQLVSSRYFNEANKVKTILALGVKSGKGRDCYQVIATGILEVVNGIYDRPADVPDVSTVYKDKIYLVKEEDGYYYLYFYNEAIEARDKTRITKPSIFENIENGWTAYIGRDDKLRYDIDFITKDDVKTLIEENDVIMKEYVANAIAQAEISGDGDIDLSGFAPKTHEHTVSDITDLPSIVSDVKVNGVSTVIREDGKRVANLTMTINNEGYWVINGVSTNVKAKGDAFTYEDFTPEQLEALKGEDGITPTIDSNGYWVIGEEQTGVKAAAPTIEINEEGYWVIDGVTSDVKARGEDGGAGYIFDENDFNLTPQVESDGTLVSLKRGLTQDMYDYLLSKLNYTYTYSVNITKSPETINSPSNVTSVTFTATFRASKRNDSGTVNLTVSGVTGVTTGWTSTGVNTFTKTVDVDYTKSSVSSGTINGTVAVTEGRSGNASGSSSVNITKPWFVFESDTEMFESDTDVVEQLITGTLSELEKSNSTINREITITNTKPYLWFALPGTRTNIDANQIAGLSSLLSIGGSSILCSPSTTLGTYKLYRWGTPLSPGELKFNLTIN
jgi:hypothetical protein